MKARILALTALLTLLLGWGLMAWLRARAHAAPGEATGARNFELFLVLAPAIPCLAWAGAALALTRARRWLWALAPCALFTLAALLGLEGLSSWGPALERALGAAGSTLAFALQAGAAPLGMVLGWWAGKRS